MKLVFKVLVAAALTTAASSCSSFLDINNNPNNPTSVTADGILAQALAVTAANYTGNNPSYNSYASWVASYWGKTGVVSGYGEELTYNYSSSYYAGLFSNTYDNLQDYQLIQDQGGSGYPYHAAIARIMKVYNFLLLVDEYGNVPYFNALKGLNGTSPKYDDAKAIYADLLVQLDGAITDINNTDASATPTFTPRAVGAEDIVFQGNMPRWKKFANSLKLRILMRESQTNDAALNSSVAQQLTALQTAKDGFITSDVVAQPNYVQSSGQQNPIYNRYAYTAAGTGATERSYQIPTQFILNQYSNNKDPRLSQLYTQGARFINGAAVTGLYVGAIPGESNSPVFTATSQLSDDAPTQASRFLGANSTTASGGIIKGFNAPTPLMLLSEQLFLQAEAETRGLFTGGDALAKTDYQNGILASFLYYYRAANTSLATINGSNISSATSATPGFTQYTTFAATWAAGGSNASNPLVNYDAATSNGSLGKQAIILYQKYLAMNSIASTEAWDDYRRAAQPQLPASSLSQSPRADKLPTRLLYPQTEINTNGANVPAGVTQYTKIFWDVVD